MLVLIASCLVADSPNKIEQGLLISAYWVLMISHAALAGQVRRSNHHWTGRGLLLFDFHMVQLRLVEMQLKFQNCRIVEFFFSFFIMFFSEQMISYSTYLLNLNKSCWGP